VTGLGAITPLDVGIRKSWSRLLAGHTGITSLRSRPEFRAIPSQVAGLVPRGSRADGGWDPREWLDKADERRMAPFAQYAVTAAAEAIEDASLQNICNAEKKKVLREYRLWHRQLRECSKRSVSL
jgi:3-oxoacyl-[acyl-carrier-protein] synthase II